MADPFLFAELQRFAAGEREGKLSDSTGGR
jgi:hypothetical protein